MGGTSVDRTDRLREEAVYIARRVFGVNFREADVVRYAAANELLRIGDGGWDERVQRLLDRSIDERADVEALEFVLRLSRRRNLITQKLHVVAFLLESDPAHVSRFLNEKRSRRRAAASLVTHGVRAVGKYVRGRWLLRKFKATDA